MEVTSSSTPPDPCTQLFPAFTEQDERREMASLSATELASVEADLRGITLGMASVGIEERGDVDRRAEGLRRLDAELSKIPLSQKMVYLDAVTKCPEQINDEKKMAFLEREDFDAELAAARLARYWEAKLAVFGPEKCFLPLSLSGAMKDEVAGMVKYCPLRVLSAKDAAGRSILSLRPGRRDPSKYSTKSMLMALWYIFEAVAEERQARKQGVVILLHLVDARFVNFDPVVIQYVGHFFWNILPLPCRSIHACHPNPIVYHVIFPMLKYLFSRETRLRLKLHRGSEEKVLQDLESYYCLPRECVPTDLGGKVICDPEKWISDRLLIENQRHLSHGHALEPETDCCFGERVAKRMRSEKDQNHTDESTRSVRADSVPSAELPQLQGGRAKKVFGRKGDPRMNRAVEAKLANPDMSTREALLIGGYKFDAPKSGEPHDSALDSDNVSLKQRRNQLGRRIRQATREKTAAKEVGVKRGSDDDVKLSRDEPCSPGIVSAPTSTDVDVKIAQKVTSTDVGEGDAGDDSCDEFYENILGLPGIEDVAGDESCDEFYQSILDLPGVEDLG